MKKLIIFLITFFIVSKNVNAELIDLSNDNNKIEIEKYVPFVSSILIPGSGQIINQDYLKGIILFTSILSLICFDILYLNPTITNNQINKKQNSFIEILFFVNRVIVPSLWLYNVSDIYKSIFEKDKDKKQETEFEILSFRVNLLSLKF
jgi:hypothetical protein